MPSMRWAHEVFMGSHSEPLKRKLMNRKTAIRRYGRIYTSGLLDRLKASVSDLSVSKSPLNSTIQY